MIDVSRLYCGAAGGADGLRYGRASAGRRPPRPVVVWNCTRRCGLRCAHCYSGSTDAPAAGELSLDEGRALLDDLAAMHVPVVLFSGGEPLDRPDVFELLSHAAGLGLRTALSTNGTRIDAATAERLAEAGVGYVGVSVDGTEATHDRFRGRPGAYAAALAGIRNARRAALKVGLRCTLTRANADELPALLALLRTEDIPRACFYHLVPIGRGDGLADQALDAAATRRAVDTILDETARLHAAGGRAEILTVDNHADGAYLYLRMRREGDPRAAEVLRLLRAAGGNASGERIACVSWDGAVYPDPFWRTAPLGNVRERPFSAVWANGADGLLAVLRRRPRPVTGRCATCRFLDICGGNLRARAEVLTHDRWAPDPACYLSDAEIAGPPPEADDA